MTSHVVIPVTDATQVGVARRHIRRLAEEAQLDETASGRAAVIATELATNLMQHTTGGQLLLRGGTGTAAPWVEVFSIDRGPGMGDVARCFEDGYSTAGTPGGGLGAVRRMASEFDVYSQQPAGTVAYARITASGAGVAGEGGGIARGVSWGAVSIPAPGETACGDSWRVAYEDGVAAAVVVDGLGHGPLAAEAAAAAIAVFDSDPFAPAESFFQRAHGAMSGTRGGAVALARINVNTGVLHYAGVGNIAGVLAAEAVGRKGLVSHNGTVGVQVRQIQTFEYSAPAGGMLVMHSDGLQTRWTLDGYPELALRHPAIVAGVLARDFIRGKDDATVVVVRLARAS